MFWAVLGIAFIIYLAISFYKDHKRDCAAVAAAREIVLQIYMEISHFLRQTYPFITFNLPSKDSVLRTLLSISSPSKLEQEQLLKNALLPVIEKATSDYLQHNPNLRSIPKVTKDLGSPQFWEKESQYREIKEGRDPPDWEARRMIVHKRDGGQCKRCGQIIDISECHIHHIKRRSDGGNHALENLMTLCKDCHSLMVGHDSMHAIRPYVISGRGTIHLPRCHSGRGGRTVWDSVPKLQAKGLRPCRRCNPWGSHRDAMFFWKPQIHHAILDIIKKYSKSKSL